MASFQSLSYLILTTRGNLKVTGAQKASDAMSSAPFTYKILELYRKFK
jgi:hypothetical protein